MAKTEQPAAAWIPSKEAGLEPLSVLGRFYEPGTALYHLLVRHGRQVAAKSRRIARRLNDPAVDMDFIEEAALLHDIGIIGVRAPDLGCTGTADYICHGVIGREMLESLGLARHGLVCERHVGVGLTVEDIRENNFPLPLRDMRPVALEETIIAYADKFYSKHPTPSGREYRVEEVASHLARYGRRPVRIFLEWAERFGDR